MGPPAAPAAQSGFDCRGYEIYLLIILLPPTPSLYRDGVTQLLNISSSFTVPDTAHANNTIVKTEEKLNASSSINTSVYCNLSQREVVLSVSLPFVLHELYENLISTFNFEQYYWGLYCLFRLQWHTSFEEHVNKLISATVDNSIPISHVPFNTIS